MRLSEFKKGDIIQRRKPTENSDKSYIGDRLEFLGHESGIIFFRQLNAVPEHLKRIVVSLPDYGWDDDGWDYYPEGFYQKLKSIFNG